MLLASANYVALDPKQARKCRPYPPLATLLAAAGLRAAGLRVALFDATLADDEGAFLAQVDVMRPRVVALYEDNFNFLSKMCLARMREAALVMACGARAVGSRVVAAGADVSDHPERYLRHGVDYALTGEPDHSLRELVLILLGLAPGDPLAVPGVVAVEPADPCRLRHAPSRAPERHLDVFPPAAWDLIEVEAYRTRWREAHGRLSLNLVTTRGCPFHCNWCAKPIWGQRYAMHSPARVARDLADLKRQCAPDHVWFADDIFGLRTGWVLDFAAEVEALDARIPFTIQTRADLMTDAAVKALARAGCEEVWLGAESGSQAILDAMDKGTDLRDIARARTLLGRHGIRAAFFLQFGYPGEEWPEVAQTLDMVRTLMPDDIGVSVTYPLPGTGLHARVRHELGEKTHWADSDDLAMMFQGTYTTAFYRQIHARLHREFDLRRAIAKQSAAAAAALPLVMAEWEEMAATERDHRSVAPVRPVRLPSPDRPALLADAN